MAQFGLQFRQRTPCNGDMARSVSSYKEAAQYMANVRIMPNFAQTGSYERMHVKGRVIEAGLAGCLLLEQADSPTRDWFEAGVDYLPYQSMGQAKEIVLNMANKPQESQQYLQAYQLPTNDRPDK